MTSVFAAIFSAYPLLVYLFISTMSWAGVVEPCFHIVSRMPQRMNGFASITLFMTALNVAGSFSGRSAISGRRSLMNPVTIRDHS